MIRIAFRKISDERHALELIRENGAREEVECETRSYLHHDLLHYAVELEAGLDAGFWGNLAKGKTLADMNDRTGEGMKDDGPDMAVIEQIVGALHGVGKGPSPTELVSGLRRYAASLEKSLPTWVSEELVVAVKERMRKLSGHWRATAYGGRMELEWPHPEMARQESSTREKMRP